MFVANYLGEKVRVAFYKRITVKDVNDKMTLRFGYEH